MGCSELWKNTIFPEHPVQNEVNDKKGEKQGKALEYVYEAKNELVTSGHLCFILAFDLYFKQNMHNFRKRDSNVPLPELKGMHVNLTTF